MTPVPKIFTDGGAPGGMSGSLRRRKKRRSVGHRSRTGSRASAPLLSRTRKDSTNLWTRSIRRTSSPRPQLLSAPARVAELRSSPPSYELRSGPPPHALAPAPALLRSAATRARRRRKRSVAELSGGGSAQWLAAELGAEEAHGGGRPSSGQRTEEEQGRVARWPHQRRSP